MSMIQRNSNNFFPHHFGSSSTDGTFKSSGSSIGPDTADSTPNMTPKLCPVSLGGACQSPVRPRPPIQQPQVLHEQVARFCSEYLLQLNYISVPEDKQTLVEEEREVINVLNSTLWCLYGKAPAPMRLEDYCHRLITYSRCSPETMVVATCHVERLARSGLPITPRCIHRVLMTCLLLAIKDREDIFYPTNYYAQVGGLNPADLKAMELECFVLLGFDCGVTIEEFDSMVIRLTKCHSNWRTDQQVL